MTLLAAFNLLLHRHTRQNDILVGSPVANRNQENTESLIGLFVNVVVLRLDLSGEPGFLELLKRTRTIVLGAHEHPDVPFEKLVQELAPERDPSRSPLFQVMLNMLNLQEETLRVTGLEMRVAGEG